MGTMTWYERILVKKRKETVSAVVFAILFALSVTLWHYAMGKSFGWQSISPVEVPDLLPRLFYSALVYVTLGKILYNLGFYKVLYSLYRGMSGGWRAYNKTKDLIWWILIGGMYFAIIPVVVNILNAVLSFFYNAYVLILYLFTSLGISVLVFGVGWFALKKYKQLSK